MKNASCADKIICAIDTPSVEEAIQILDQVKPYITMAKLGLEFFVANGPKAVQQIADRTGLDIFLDLKLYDIPNTVAKTIERINAIPAVKLTTIHASGGSEMMKLAQQTARDSLKLLAVTVLTSKNQQDLEDIDVNLTPNEHVLSLAKLAEKSGILGLVCSGEEIASLKQQNKNFNLVVPGIRPANSSANDQKRVLTPLEAINLGADYLVIGRPITAAPDIANAAKDIANFA